MTTATHRVAILLATTILCIGQGAGRSEGEYASTSAYPPASISHDTAAGLTDGEQRIVALGLRLYSEAGIELPELDIQFHDDLAPCFGNAGFYRHYVDRPDIIDVCADPSGPTDKTIQQTRTLWHELAHAHLSPRLSDQAKAEFTAFVGADAWQSDEWHRQGTEYAAEILVWGIVGGNLEMHRGLDDLDCPTLIGGLKLISDIQREAC